MPVQPGVGTEQAVTAILVEQDLQEGNRRDGFEQKLVDAARRPVNQKELAGTDAQPAALRQATHPGLEFAAAVGRRVFVGDRGEVIVARIGVPAVAVLAATRQRLLVVALDAPDPALLEQRPDLLRPGTEAAEIAETVHGLGTTSPRILQQRRQRKVVAVRAAEHGNPGVRPFDPGVVPIRGNESIDRTLSCCGVEPAPRAGRGAAELVEWNEPLPPGRLAAVVREG